MQTITKKQLTDKIADQLGHKRAIVKDVVQLFLDEIINELAEGNRLEFRDFGVFETKQRKPRVAQNPRTLERVAVPIKWTVKFKVGRMMKQKVQVDGATPTPRPPRLVQPVAEADGIPGKPATFQS